MTKIIDRLPTPVRVLLVFAALYFFLVGIGSMSTAFKMMGKNYVEQILGTTTNPLVSLFIGILATTLLQSSSTTTSLVVGLVAAGALPFHSAAFMVMGANVGTTVTNTIVSLGHITRSGEYRRAFAAATVHDFFNLIVLFVLFPLEWATGVLTRISIVATDVFDGVGGTKLANPIKAATKPTINQLKEWATGMGGGGGLLLFLAILITFTMLILLVKSMRSLMAKKLEKFFDRILFRSPFRSLLFGLFLTVLVQSSSITTSVAVPLVGAGILTIRQVFPYTMGANIGTTVTALLASLGALAAADVDGRATAMLGLQVAFHHVLFNIFGVALVYKFQRLPIAMAEAFARLAVWNRLVPLVYIVLVFYLVPFVIVWVSR